MAFFEWDESYSVGVPELDDQHRVLIDIINDLDRIENEGGSIRGALDRLEWYVNEHFSYEEKLMREAKYDDFDRHVEAHRAFEKWLRSSQVHLTASGLETSQMASVINEYLKGWLTKHILVVDMDYKSLLATDS